MNLISFIKHEIRAFANKNANGYTYSAAPIVVQDGYFAPYYIGNSFHYENKSGEIIRNPSAYRRAWGKPIYVSSTRKILVGREWIKQLQLDLLQVKLTRTKKNGRLASRDLAVFCLLVWSDKELEEYLK